LGGGLGGGPGGRTGGQEHQGGGEQKLREETERLESARQAAEREQRQDVEQRELSRQELTARAAEVEGQSRDLAQREEAHRAAVERLEDAERSLDGQRQALATERIGWEVERQAAQEAADQTRAQIEAARNELEPLVKLLPDLEARAAAALDRLARGREQLREHLAELH